MLRMREIGGEFWNVPISDKDNKIFPEDTAWFLSGRSALSAIIAENNFKRVALPYWTCESIIKPFVNGKIEICFYDEEEIDAIANADAIVIMDYFGYTSHRCSVKKFDGIIIRDVTHSIFSAVYEDADYYFGSLRKWSGFWTGGYAWGLKQKKENSDKYFTQLRKTAMEEKESYIRGLSENKGYLKIYDEAEKYLETCKIMGADPRDIRLAKFFDVDFIKTQRRKNAQILLNAFSDIALFPELKDMDCPMFVPVLFPDAERDMLRSHLIKRNIYCPVHWPMSKYHKINNNVKEIYDNELSLVCDQRYTERDMEYLVEIVNDFLLRKRGCLC